MRGFIEEVKRRNVAKVALVYIIAGWLTMQVVDVMFPALNLPEWLISAVAAFVIIGFPFALIFAWAFEMTPEGIKLEKDVDKSQSISHQTGQRIMRNTAIALGIAVVLLLVDRFTMEPPSNQLLNNRKQFSSSVSICLCSKPHVIVGFCHQFYV